METRFQQAYDYLIKKGSVSSKTELAKIMGVGRTSVSNAYNGNTDYLNEKFLIKFCNSFPGVFSLDWLLNGDGEMLKASQKPQETPKLEWDITNQEGVMKMLMEQNKMFMKMIMDNEEYRKRHDAKVDEELSELRSILLRLIKQEYGMATFRDTALVNDELQNMIKQ